MFDRSWVVYPCATLVECLVVFAVLFLAGALWAWGLRQYVAWRLKDGRHE